MKECVVTGLLTNRMWKNKPIHPAVHEKVKSIPKAGSRTMRSELKRFDNKFKDASKGRYQHRENEITPEEYVDFVNNFIKDYE